MRKRVRGIDRDRRESGETVFTKNSSMYSRASGGSSSRSRHADRFFRERGDEFLAPASVLIRHECVDPFDELGENFFLRAAIWAGVAASLLDLLQEAGEAHLDELVEIARRDGQEFHAIEERVRRIARLFEHALVELQPREVAIGTARGRRCEWVT